MRIYNNVNAIVTQNALTQTNTAMSKSLEKLSTGLRINRAADDAAGLSVSEGLRSQIRGSEQSRRNSNDAIAMMQIAESGAQSITDSLQRMRELAIQSANGTYSNTERGYIQQEYDQLASEVTRISQAVTYNGISLLTDAATFTFQVSAMGTGPATTISFVTTNLMACSTGLDLAGSAVSSQSLAQVAIASIDVALGSVLNLRATIGAVMNRLEKTIDALGVMISNYSDAESRIRDLDFATETTKFTRNQILTQSGTSMLAQANQLPQGVLSLLK
jgi:flagellin